MKKLLSLVGAGMLATSAVAPLVANTTYEPKTEEVISSEDKFETTKDLISVQEEMTSDHGKGIKKKHLTDHELIKIINIALKEKTKEKQGLKLVNELKEYYDYGENSYNSWNLWSSTWKLSDNVVKTIQTLLNISEIIELESFLFALLSELGIVSDILIAIVAWVEAQWLLNDPSSYDEGSGIGIDFNCVFCVPSYINGVWSQKDWIA